MHEAQTNPLATRIRAEIERGGPMPFSRFMDLALYDGEFGYYRSRDPFGVHGDFYTAEQIQPVFGRLAAQWMEQLRAALGAPPDFTLLEMGAGRAEMAEAFAAFRYVPVDLGRGAVPREFTGVVFANEFFDALPVEVLRRDDGPWRRMRVGAASPGNEEDSFRWVYGEPAAGQLLEYAGRNAPPGDEVRQLEVCPEAARWVDDLSRRLVRGFLVFIDYGYQRRELVRFPEGTLMSYRSHHASPDVLLEPGTRDITAHVNFTEIRERIAGNGLDPVSEQSLAAALLRAGEPDGFETALRAASAAEQVRLRLQLKTLLFGMGESFRVLVAAKNV